MYYIFFISDLFSIILRSILSVRIAAVSVIDGFVINEVKVATPAPWLDNAFGSPRRSNLILIKKIYKYGLAHAHTAAAAQHRLLFFRKYEIQFSIRTDYTETACSTLSLIPFPTIFLISRSRGISLLSVREHYFRARSCFFAGCAKF